MSSVLPPGAGHFRVVKDPSGGCADVHELPGRQEMRENLAIAILLAKSGERVCLLPVSRTEGIKSADATRDGVIREFKVPAGHTANAVDDTLRDGSRQSARILIQVTVTFSVAALEQALFDRLRRMPATQEVAILRDDYLTNYTRQEITGNTFRGKLA